MSQYMVIYGRAITRGHAVKSKLHEYTMIANKPFRIVILGAGYAGMFLAINLYQTFKERSTGERNGKDSPADVEIILVDRNPYHQLLQEIHLVAAGYRTAEQISIPITSLIKGTKIRFIQSYVKEVITYDNKVILDESMINYDLAAICLGSTTKYFGIEGAKSNTIPFRSIDDAVLVHKKIQSLFPSKRSNTINNIKKRDDGVKKRTKNKDNNINIVIVGGGATGVSLGGAIADFLNDETILEEHFSSTHIEINFNVTIVEATSNILTGWNSELASKAQTILASKGVRILTNSEVSNIEHDNLILKDGSIIDSSLIVWTAGVKGYEIKITPPTDKAKDGRIIVNRFCQIDKYPNIFVIGDIAAVKDSQGKLYPPIAQIAVREAKYLADVIPKHFSKFKYENNNINIKNVITLKHQDVFDYDIKVQIISLGADDYVGLFGSHVINGNLAKMIDEFGKFAYVKTLKTRGEGISSKLYEDSMLSRMIAGISFAGFAFAKWIDLAGLGE
ncbi:MAG: FAD-dependent oxidoreductase [Nitrososphaeraceae archaeon]